MSITPQRSRCAWPGSDPLYCAYHDLEWGVPERDGGALFEKLVLDGFQAGLSWITILRKREAFRAAFAGFNPDEMVGFDEARIASLLSDPGIVRSRAKILGAIANARAYLQMRQAGEDFSDFIWSFTDGEVLHNRWASPGPAPVKTPISEALSKALYQRGFKFCGPVIVYAFLQAVGVVNDHVPECFRYAELGGSKAT